MKKLLFCILYCSSTKVCAAEKRCLRAPSYNQRNAIVIFENTEDIVAFTIRVGMEKETIEQAILEMSQSKNKQNFLILCKGSKLPTIITNKYLNTYYPKNKIIELHVFSEQ